MGCNSSLVQYAVPITRPEDAKGESAIYRSPVAKSKLVDPVSDSASSATLQEMFLNTTKKYGSKQFLGSRKQLPDGQLGPYEFKTYDEVLNICQQVGSGILNLDLAPNINEYNNMDFRFVSVYSKNRAEYLELDIACTLFGLTLVPIYDTLGPESVHFTFTQTNLTTVFASNNFVLPLLKDIKAGKCGKLVNIVSFEKPKDEQLSQANEIGVRLLHWSDILEAGKKNSKPYQNITSETIFTFSYTSGTTGTPKGAMLSHGNAVAVIIGADYKTDTTFRSTDIHLSYLPMAHVLERIFVWRVIFYGACVGFFNGDVQKLKDDIQELKPTIFVSVPRLFNRFYDTMNAGINKLTGFKKTLAEKAITAKLNNLHNYAQYTHSVYDALVFKKTKEALGGRVRFMVTGSAPITEKVMDFLKIAVCCPIFEGYGQTESAAASFLTSSNDGKSGHVGGPVACLEYKVVDVPEMNYTAKDLDAQGELLPRGEVCLRGPSVFKGYYKDPAKTSEAIDKDGWLHTGDIGQISKNGGLKIIDRKKNIFKLAIGEYIAAEKIENIYLRSKYVAEVFLYGDSLQHYLVAIIVPNKNHIEALGKELSLQGTYEELCENQQIINKVLEDMNKVGRSEKLFSFELAKKLKIVPFSFSEKGLMTPSFKLKRHDAKVHYKSVIDAMYAEPLLEDKK